MRRAARGLGIALLLIVIAASAGTLVPRPFYQSEDDGPATHRILLLTNPIHTDIAIRIDSAVRRQFSFLEQDGAPIGHPDASWLVVGWGGRAFYLETPTWSELKPGPVFKALTIDRSVMHVDVAAAIPEDDPAVTPIVIDEEGYVRLVAFMLRSFQKRAGRPAVIVGSAYGPNDLFYEAVGSFNAFVGCNTWTARALREAGLRTGWWNPLPFNLATSLSLHNPDLVAR